MYQSKSEILWNTIAGLDLEKNHHKWESLSYESNGTLKLLV